MDYIDNLLKRLAGEAVSLPIPPVPNTGSTTLNCIISKILLSDKPDYELVCHLLSSIDNGFIEAYKEKIEHYGLSPRLLSLLHEIFANGAEIKGTRTSGGVCLCTSIGVVHFNSTRRSVISREPLPFNEIQKKFKKDLVLRDPVMIGQQIWATDGTNSYVLGHNNTFCGTIKSILPKLPILPLHMDQAFPSCLDANSSNDSFLPEQVRLNNTTKNTTNEKIIQKRPVGRPPGRKNKPKQGF